MAKRRLHKYELKKVKGGFITYGYMPFGIPVSPYAYPFYTPIPYGFPYMGYPYGSQGGGYQQQQGGTSGGGELDLMTLLLPLLLGDDLDISSLLGGLG